MNFKSHIFNVAYRNVNGKYLFEEKNVLSEFKVIKNPLFHWCADPFPIVIDKKRYIFAEMATTFGRFGQLAYICLDDKRPKWRKCYKSKKHMSFPNCFVCDGKIICVPETSHNAELCKYIFDLNKKQFIKGDAILSNHTCVDSVFIKNSHELFFTYDINSGYINNYLTMRRTNNPSCKVFSLVDYKNKLRPAGNIFELKGEYIFPSQDCSKIYGGGIIFNLIKICKDCFLVQETISKITADDVLIYLKQKKAIGCHTYNFCNELEVIDILFRKFSILRFIKKVLIKLFKIK